jgi:hypothetical protein
LKLPSPMFINGPVLTLALDGAIDAPLGNHQYGFMWRW